MISLLSCHKVYHFLTLVKRMIDAEQNYVLVALSQRGRHLCEGDIAAEIMLFSDHFVTKQAQLSLELGSYIQPLAVHDSS